MDVPSPQGRAQWRRQRGLRTQPSGQCCPISTELWLPCQATRTNQLCWGTPVTPVLGADSRNLRSSSYTEKLEVSLGYMSLSQPWPWQTQTNKLTKGEDGWAPGVGVCTHAQFHVWGRLRWEECVIKGSLGSTVRPWICFVSWSSCQEWRKVGSWSWWLLKICNHTLQQFYL